MGCICCLRWGYACGEETDEKCQREQALKIFLLSLRMDSAPFRAAQRHEKQTHGGRGDATHGMRL